MRTGVPKCIVPALLVMFMKSAFVIFPMQLPSIVVLDGYALNPGDLSWQELESLGSCAIYSRTAPAEIIPRCRGASVLLTNKTPLNAELISSLPELRYIGVLATGYNIVDIDSASARQIVVTNIPAYGTASVAQHTFALLLELTQHVGDHSQSVAAGEWSQSPDWCYWKSDLVELAGLKLGLIGAGRIAQAVASIGRALGMEVLFATSAGGIPEREHLLRESDVVSLHCPLTPETREIINSASIQLMKPTALLINTSRGPLINEIDLAAALNIGRLAGAGLDVLCVEPPPPDHPLLRTRNCLITPHQAWASLAARSRLMQVAVDNVRAFLDGTLRNVVKGAGQIS